MCVKIFTHKTTVTDFVIDKVTMVEGALGDGLTAAAFDDGDYRASLFLFPQLMSYIC